MKRALAAALGALLLMTFPAQAGTAAATLPFVQGWADTGQIRVDDDWSGVAGVVGYRGDGLASEPGSDPRGVTAHGSGTPLDVTANLTDPRAVGLAAGVAEFELTDPVVAIQGSATASAPHLVMSLDTRGRAGVTVRLVLRDIDATAHDAVEPVALQYRVGAAGAFAAVPGGYVADATTGPGEATRVSRLSVALPAAADGQPLVQVRVITTNAVGQDEWVGIDDIEVSAASAGGGGCPEPTPAPDPKPLPAPRAPNGTPLALTGLELSPATFVPAKRGPATTRRGHAGSALRFRLSRAALVRFEVVPARAVRDELAPKGWRELFAPEAGRAEAARGRVARKAGRGRVARKADRGRVARKADRGRVARQADRVARKAGRVARGWAPSTGGRFSVRGRRGRNRLRFTGRLRGRPLAEGAYVLGAVAVDRSGRSSARAATRFRIGRED